MASKSSPVEISHSRDFLSWLHDERLSLAFTTYQTNRLFLVGRKPDGTLSTFERLFDRPMGLARDGDDGLLMTTRYQLWELRNALPPGVTHEGYDALFVPRRAHTTGDVDAHDVARDATGRILFVNTLYGCLATVSERYSFRPLWQPPFLSALVPEDRCHLNGLAMAEGEARFLSAVSRSDVAAGWRDRRAEGGILLDVRDQRIALRGLSMPHSPRLHEGELWLLNAGTGELGRADLAAERFEPLAFLPGFARGLAMHGRWAVVGLSRPRGNRAFQGLPLDARLHDKDAEPICGLYVIDLQTGRVAHWLRLDGIVTELYDVALLPAIRQPMALGFKSDEIARLLTIEGEPPRWEPLVATGEAAPILDFQALAETTPPPPPIRQAAPTRDPIEALRRAQQRGNVEQAEQGFRALLGAEPDNVRGWHFLGQLFASQARWSEAHFAFARAASLQPEQPAHAHNEGEALRSLGRLDEARAAYQRALQSRPGYALSLRSLAALLSAQGESAAALPLLEALLRATPNDPALLNQVALLHYEQGNVAQAQQLWRRVLKIDPTHAEAHNNLGSLLKLTGKFDEARAAYERALQHEPTHRLAQRNLGNLHGERGEWELARRHFAQALALGPEPLLALHRALMPPPIMAGRAAIEALHSQAWAIIENQPPLRLDLATLHSSHGEPPTLWAYHGRDDDHRLKARYSALFADQFPTEPQPGSGEGRPHVGILITPGHEGVFRRAMARTALRLAERFRVTVVAAAAAQPFLAEALPDVALAALPLRFDGMVAALRALRLDALYFWEAGTDSANFFLPFCRLAPVQVTGWGWPVTSAAPQMDAFLCSAALLSPQSGDFFTEPLVGLAGLPGSLPRPPIAHAPPPRHHFGLPEGGTLYLCVQNLRKVHPDMDALVSGILAGDPTAVVRFVADRHPAVTAQLQARWAVTVPDAGARLGFVPWQSVEGYYQLLPLADVLLDTPHFGGALTTYDALAAGIPPVTLPGPQPRSRVAAALLGALEVTETVAESAEGYVAAALRLGTDAALRLRLRQQLYQAAPMLWQDWRAADALGAWLDEAITQARATA